MTEEDEEFERIEREQARANALLKKQLENEPEQRCPICKRIWEKDDHAG